MLIVKKCPNCGFEIQSLYENQAEFNMRSHLILCNKRMNLNEMNEDKVHTSSSTWKSTSKITQAKGH